MFDMLDYKLRVEIDIEIYETIFNSQIHNFAYIQF